MMQRNTIIFDLAEVLCYGLVGTEDVLAAELSVSKESIQEERCRNGFFALLRGEISEEEYLKRLIAKSGWKITLQRLQEIVRDNFRRQVPGTAALAGALASEYRLVLLSDHAREWIEYVESCHEFLTLFSRRFYSFELGSIKADAGTFGRVLEQLSVTAQECLFIDDRIDNIRAAELVGIAGIVFRNAEDLRRQLIKKGVSEQIFAALDPSDT